MTEEELITLKKWAALDMDYAREYLEEIATMGDYFETWAKHCGAPRDVFIGHLVAALVKEE